MGSPSYILRYMPCMTINYLVSNLNHTCKLHDVTRVIKSETKCFINRAYRREEINIAVTKTVTFLLQNYVYQIS